MVCVVLFIIAYFAIDIGDNHDTAAGLGASTLALGGTLGLALLFIGVGVIQWARKLMGDHEIVEMRHPAVSSDEDRERVIADLTAGAEESGIGRRPLLRNTMLGALGLVGITPIIALRDLGPLPGDSLMHTAWRAGMRGRRRRARHTHPARGPGVRHPGQLPARRHLRARRGGRAALRGRRPPRRESQGVADHRPDGARGDHPRSWTGERSVDGIQGFSKICTHVGCPISLYERTTHHVLCPCHQSTFDLSDSAAVDLRARQPPLPQLPLAVDDEGYLIAQSDFTEPVGPSFWERDCREPSHTSKVADSIRGSAATAQKPSKVGAVANWADERLGPATAMKKQIRKVFPDHWSFMLGEVAL